MEKRETKILKVNKDNPEKEKIKLAAQVIKQGGIVAFPTETVYGLGANCFDEKALDSIFIAKGRPQDNPLILHVSSIDEVYPLVKNVPQRASILMKKFWPGPLTIIFNKSDKVSKKVTAGLSTVAIRMPDHKVAQNLIRQSHVAIAAPSANLSGKPSPTEAQHVTKDLYGRIDMIIDGGKTGIGVESTVLDISGEIPTILRPGGITLENLLEVFPKVEYDLGIIKDNENIVPKSPGQKYKHYAPKAKMIGFSGQIGDVVSNINLNLQKFTNQNKKVGIIATEETKKEYKNGIILTIGSRKNPETIASNLFKVLRKFDEIGVDIILAEGVENIGIGTAIMNRMKKACGGDIRKV